VLLNHPRRPHSSRRVSSPKSQCRLKELRPTLPNADNRATTQRLTFLPNSVKTRIQLDPVKYNSGLVGGFRKVIAEEGFGAVWTGVGPTFAGYFLQGAFKFGGYEFFKKQAIDYLGVETASNNRTAVYLGSSACAEFFADIALCPLEATRIRLVSEPTFANGLIGGFSKILKNEGVMAFYSGFGPILLKQYVPTEQSKKTPLQTER
jgi:solute carrier family 25 (mitochondrial phosphate transporter), member 3